MQEPKLKKKLIKKKISRKGRRFKGVFQKTEKNNKKK